MDFRTCPSCKASVLEDDAEDCPFCGASMSGKGKTSAPKPTAAPTAVRPNQKKSAPVVPAVGNAPGSPQAFKPVGSRVERAQKSDEAGDPFDVDNVALRSASPVSAKAVKGRSIEVVCPMCETKGYISEKQAGRDVKCCNATCMVPVYRAPALARKSDGPVVEKGMSTGTLAIVGLIAAVAIGGGLYAFVFKGPGEKPQDVAPTTVQQPTAADKLATTTSIIPDSDVRRAEEKPPADLDELEGEALKLIVKAGQSRGDTRSQPVTKQLAVEALAIRNKPAEAREQLAYLRQMGGNRGANEVEPLVRLGWLELKAGDNDAAGKTATAALKSAEQLPKVGRETIDSATALAGLLTALGRGTEATKLIQNIPADDRARASAVWTVARETGTFDVSSAMKTSFLFANPNCPMSAAAFVAALNGDPAEAVKWVKTSSNAAARDAGLAACAAGVAWVAPSKSESGVPAPLDAEFAAAGPAARVRMLSAVADMELLRGDQAAAAGTLAKAEAIAGSLAPGAAMMMPDLAEIYRSEGKPYAGLPDPFPALGDALALGDVGDLQMRMNRKDAGWINIQKGLAFLRTATPSADAVQALLDQSEKQAGEMQERLRTELQLPDDRPKLFLALSRYRKQLQVLLGISRRRMSLGEALLERAVDRGALELVAPLAVERHTARGNDRESYLTGDLGGVLMHTAQRAGKPELVQTLTAAEGKIQVPANLVGLTQARAAFDAGNPEEAAESLRGVYANPNLERWMTDVRVLGAVTGNLGTDKAFDFAHRLRDPLIREDALRLIAARSIRDKSWPAMWKHLNETASLNHTDRAAILLGFLEALSKS